jgi:multidrug efflux pump subunit AcrA (membrane-fusion protein)
MRRFQPRGASFEQKPNCFSLASISSGLSLWRYLPGFLMRFLRWPLRLIVPIAGIAGCFFPNAAIAEEASVDSVASTVLVTSAAQACFSKVVSVTGFLVPRTPAIVSLDLEGYQVAEVFANEGDRVTIGQTLVRVARIATDNNQPAPNPTNPAMAGQGGAGGLPSSFLLRAPAGGTIIKSRADIGAVSSPRGDPLFQIAADNIIEVDAEVPGLYVAEIAEGQTAAIIAEQGEVSGRVRLVGGEIDPVSHMGHVRLSVSPDFPLRAGGFVRASIDTSRSCGVSIPRSAVLHGSDGVSVQIVRGHIIETHRVRLGLYSDHDVEIREGVRVGDLVVAHAGTSLRNGDEVTTRPIDEQEQTGRR